MLTVVIIGSHKGDFGSTKQLYLRHYTDPLHGKHTMTKAYFYPILFCVGVLVLRQTLARCLKQLLSLTK